MAERGTETYYDTATRSRRTRETLDYGSSGKSIAHVRDEQKSALAAAAERVSKASQQRTPMPKQQEGESPAAYSERLRIWRMKKD